MSILIWIATAVSFVAMISVVITVHELGHYWVGRIFGAAVESFSIGFGRPILQRKDKRGTRWRLNWMPLGGFVKFVGESQLPGDVGKIEQGPIGKAYTSLNPWQRMAVSFGGPISNFIFAIVVLSVAAMTLGIVEAKQVRVAEVTKGGAAEAAGFHIGDVLLKANDRPVKSAQDVILVTQLNSGDPVRYLIDRGGQEVALVATPKMLPVDETQLGRSQSTGKIGVRLEFAGETLRRLNPIDAVGHGVGQVGDTIGTTVSVIQRLFAGKENLDKFSGPVGVVSITGSIVNGAMTQPGGTFWEGLGLTLVNLVLMAAALSVGVGFFNLLPIPVLDGGAIVLCLAEGLTRREIPEKVQRVGLTIGLACLLTFAVVITWNDILRFRIG